MKLYTVYANSKHVANSGNEYPVSIAFDIDSRGRISNVKNDGGLFHRPYHLIKLLSEIVAADPQLAKIVNYGKGVEFVENPANHGNKHPALEVDGAKRYRLTHEVGEEWLSNPNALRMAAYVVFLEQRNPTVAWLVAKRCANYSWLNASCSPDWEWCVQVH